MKGWIMGSLDVDHGAGVKLQYSFLQVVKDFVEAEPSMAGGEGRHKDIQVHRGQTVVDHLSVLDFYAFLGQDAHVGNLVLVAVHKLEKGLRVCKFFDLNLVGTLAKLSPHRV